MEPNPNKSEHLPANCISDYQLCSWTVVFAVLVKVVLSKIFKTVIFCLKHRLYIFPSWTFYNPAEMSWKFFLLKSIDTQISEELWEILDINLFWDHENT